MGWILGRSRRSRGSRGPYTSAVDSLGHSADHGGRIFGLYVRFPLVLQPDAHVFFSDDSAGLRRGVLGYPLAPEEAQITVRRE